MSFSFAVTIIALLFSFFVVGAILGAVFSRPFREKVVTVLQSGIAFWSPVLTRSARNPILTPGKNLWTAEAVLNPAAALIHDRVHLIYRAIGMDGVSRFGYAGSQDGITIDRRLPYPIYVARQVQNTPLHARRYAPVMYPSGGSWGGCEDPRMVVINGRVYVTFNMFDNWHLRIGLITMSEEDFLAEHFGAWEGPIMLSRGNREKNWVLFPEKIGGQFAILHGIIDEDVNRVRVVYTDDLATLSSQPFETIDPQKVPDQQIAWHTHVRSAGPPPLKTDRGWLVFYHAHDAQEPSRYKLGAMLLDLEDPTYIRYRAVSPVLSPDETYENSGKPGVIYACGAIVRHGILHIYYGGADKVVCVATAPLNSFLDALVEGETPAVSVQGTNIS